jgi:hypothetical protein
MKQARGEGERKAHKSVVRQTVRLHATQSKTGKKKAKLPFLKDQPP